MKLKNSHLLILFIFISMALYFSSLHYGFFLYDDDFHIVDNKYMNAFSFDSILAFWYGDDATKIPVTYHAWQLLSFIFGKHTPMVFRYICILFHGINAFLVFITLRRFHKSISTKELPQWIFFISSLIFLCHPLQVESVVWVSSLKGVLSAFFGFIALNFFIESQKEDRQIKNIAFTTFFTALAMLSKPSAASLPLLYIFLERFIYEKDIKSLVARNSHYVFFGFAFYLLHTAEFTRKVFQFKVSVNSFIILVLSSIKFYLTKAFLPFNLSFDYQLNYTHFIQYLKGQSNALRFTIFTSLVVIWGTGLLLFYKRFRPLAIFFGVFIILCITNIGLIPYDFQNISTVADRYVYSSIFALSLGSYYIFSLLEKVPLKFRVGAVTTFLIMLTGLTIRQVGIWEVQADYFNNSLQYNESSPVLHQSRALALTKEWGPLHPEIENHLLRTLELDIGNEQAVQDKILYYYGNARKVLKGNMLINESQNGDSPATTNSKIRFYVEANYLEKAKKILYSTRFADQDIKSEDLTDYEKKVRSENRDDRKSIIKQIEAKEDRVLFYAYYQAGLLYRDNKNLLEANYHFEKALKYAKKEHDKQLLLSELMPIKRMLKRSEKK